LSAGGILSLLISGYVTQSIRPIRSGLFAVSTMAAGLILLGFAATYQQVLCGALLVGIGNLWILAPYSAVITEHFAETRARMFMLAASVFAFSAIIGNYAVGYLIEQIAPWRLVVVVLGGAIFCSFGALLLTNLRKFKAILVRPALADRTGTSLDAGASPWQSIVSYIHSGLLNRWTLWLLGFLVVLDNLSSGNMVFWTPRYFQLAYHVGEGKVGMMLAVSAAGVFSGRVLFVAFVSGRFSEFAILGVCYAGAVAMYSALLLAPNFTVGVVLFFLASALMSAQAPTMYSIASERFGPRAATAIPLIDAIGMIGSFRGPTLLGKLADATSLHAALWSIPAAGALFVMVVAAWEVHDRLTGRRTMSSARSGAAPTHRTNKLDGTALRQQDDVSTV
jgi:MFS family permease